MAMGQAAIGRQRRRVGKRVEIVGEFQPDQHLLDLLLKIECAVNTGIYAIDLCMILTSASAAII
jgi:hypothetical protein